MSHSPSDATSETARAQYTHQWRGLVQLLRQGRSFSGHERNCCFLNTGQTRFADISSVTGLDFPADSRAVLPIDWDFDGDLDFWLVSRTAPRIRLLENRLIQQGHFLAIRLEGRTANRDAIGARVELVIGGQPKRKLIKTVRAGEGFESQSSKWIHFGLGAAEPIDRVVICWPGGQMQTIRDFTFDRWYRIVQGQRRPTPWTPPQTSKLTAALPTQAKRTSRTSPTEKVRPIVLVSPIPMPQLWYKTEAGSTTALHYQPGTWTLINLWATWCLPCAEELKQFGAAEENLGNHKLRILALHVDGLHGSDQGNSKEAAAMLDRLGYVSKRGTLVRGWTTEALVTKLQLLQTPLVESDPSLVLPTSFLVDGDGALAAIYRGPVKVEQLLNDLEQRRRRPNLEQHAVGMFPGRWFQEPSYWELFGQLGDAFRNNRMLPEAMLYYAQGHRLRPEHRYLRRQYEQVRRQLQAVYRMLDQCQELVRIDPNHAAAHARLGFGYQALGDHQQAVYHLRRAIQMENDDSQTHTALGVSLAYLGEFEQAQQQFQRAVEIDPNNQDAQGNLKRLKRKKTKI